MKVEDEVELLVHCKRILTYCGFLLNTRILHVFTFMLADVCGLKLCLTLLALCAFFLSGAILKGRIPRKFYLMFVYVLFSVNCVGTDFIVFGEFVV